MKRREFLEDILPSKGWYFAAKPYTFVNDKGETVDTFTNYPCATVNDVSLQCKVLSDAGEHAYFAMGSFEKDEYFIEYKGEDKRKTRTQENAIYSRSFYIDLDCGEEKFAKGKGYRTQRDAIAGLQDFCRDYSIQLPTFLVNSGNGIHAYWVCQKDIPKALWEPIADRFKQLCKGAGLKIDDTVTGDIARVLRPIQTNNVKDPANPKEVKLIGGKRDYISLNKFAKAIQSAMDTAEITYVKSHGKRKKSKNSELSAGLDKPSDANKIADYCATIREMRDTKGALQGEELWHKCVGVLKFCVDGEKIVHEWSSGYEGYDHDETQTKINNWNVGWTTCDALRGQEGNRCEGCAAGCKFPYTLGFPDPTHQTEVVDPTGATEVLPDLPDFMKRDYAWEEGEGLKARIPSRDPDTPDRWVVASTTFAKPEFIFRDDKSGEFFVRVRNRTRPFTWHSGDISFADVAQPATLQRALASKVGLVIPGDANFMVTFMKTWINHAVSNTDLGMLVSKMGWQRDGAFVLGNRRYGTDGSVEEVPVSSSLAAQVTAHTPAGDLQRHTDIINKLYNHTGYEAYQFFYLAAYASTLLELTWKGSLGIPMVAWSRESATGKTTVAKAAISAFGDPNAFAQRARGGSGITDNALYIMAGQRNNLAVLLDETTEWTPEKYASFAYEFSDGTSKIRATQTGDLRDSSDRNWSSMVFLTTNRSVTEAMTRVYKDCRPQLARVFEVQFYRKELDTNNEVLIQELWNHHGVAGDKFLSAMVQRKEKIADLIYAERARINNDLSMSNEARFWVIAAACVLVAGKLTKRLGIHDFDMDALKEWVYGRLRAMRVHSERSVANVSTVVKDMLSDLNAGFITTTKEAVARNEVTPYVNGYSAPKGRVTGRVFADTGDVLIPVSDIRNWCHDQNIDLQDLREKIEQKGWLKNWHDYKYYLGKGTAVQVPQVRVWRINTSGIPNLSLIHSEPEVAVDVETTSSCTN